MSWYCLLAATLSLLTACSSPEDAAPHLEQVTPVEGSVDLSIGEVEGEAPYIFGRVAGVAVDSVGRILVADAQANEVRVFDEAGAHLFTFGGPGSGPAEFMYPAGLGLDRDGRLWVRDGMNARFGIFRLLDDGAEPLEVVRIEHGRPLLESPVPFDHEGRLVDIGFRFDPSTGTAAGFRLLRSLDGTVLDTVAMPAAPEERFVRHILHPPGGSRGMQTFISQPFGPHFIEAHGVEGDWAVAMSDRYEVSWFAPDGTRRHTIEASVQPPKLTPAERADAEELLQAHARQANVRATELRFSVPEQKQPLAGLFFDVNGRLWVRRSIPEGADPIADVYDKSGSRVTVVQWPAGIAFETGLVMDNVGYGVSRIEGDVDRVVRVQW